MWLRSRRRPGSDPLQGFGHETPPAVRELALAQLVSGLRGGRRVPLLHGPPSSGKTALLCSLYRHLPREYHCLVQSVRSLGPDALATRVLQQLGTGSDLDPDEVLTAYTAHLASVGGSLVLLVDDADALAADTAARLGSWLRSSQGGLRLGLAARGVGPELEALGFELDVVRLTARRPRPHPLPNLGRLPATPPPETSRELVAAALPGPPRLARRPATSPQGRPGR